MRALVASCPTCSRSVPLGRACCGRAPDLAPAPPKVRGPGFGKGPRKPVKPVNKERKAVTFARDFGIQSRLCRASGCSVPRCNANPLTAKIEPDHALTRGAGGHDDSTWPLCARHHGERHRIGLQTFEAKHGVIAEVVVGRMRVRVRDHGQPEGDDCSSFPEVDEKGRARCLVCLSKLPDDATRTP